MSAAPRHVTVDDLLDLAQWVEDDAASEDEPVREFAASVAARIREMVEDHPRRTYREPTYGWRPDDRA